MSRAVGITNVASLLANPEPILITDPAPTYGEGRRCAHDGCITVLSRYHEGDYCYAHADDEYDPRTVAMDYTEDGRRVCAECGSHYNPTLRYFRSDPGSKDGMDAVCLYCQRGVTRRAEQVQERREREARMLSDIGVFGLKFCCRCGAKLPASSEYFHRNSEAPDGLSHACKDCRNSKQRASYAADPGKFYAKTVASRERRKGTG